MNWTNRRISKTNRWISSVNSKLKLKDDWLTKQLFIRLGGSEHRESYLNLKHFFLLVRRGNRRAISCSIHSKPMLDFDSSVLSFVPSGHLVALWSFLFAITDAVLFSMCRVYLIWFNSRYRHCRKSRIPDLLINVHYSTDLLLFA